MVLVDQTLNGAIFLSYLGLAYNILTPAKGISKAFYNIRKGDAAAKRVLDILESNDDMEDSTESINIKNFEKDIRFEEVYFSYRKNNVLENFSLQIKKGQTIALVGPSGSGKTTVANLISRFYDISKGQLKLDDIPINKIKKSTLYELIGIVTQDSILFNDSVSNNIALGNPKASKEEIMEAAIVGNASEFIEKLDQGYDTIIGEGGNMLSGGQKQRVAIGRAIIREPKAFLFDEPLSNLDATLRVEMRLEISRLHKKLGITSIYVTHDQVEAMTLADKIVVLNEGQIIQTGTPYELYNHPKNLFVAGFIGTPKTVSYTHLTLPTSDLV